MEQMRGKAATDNSFSSPHHAALAVEDSSTEETLLYLHSVNYPGPPFKTFAELRVYDVHVPGPSAGPIFQITFPEAHLPRHEPHLYLTFVNQLSKNDKEAELGDKIQVDRRRRQRSAVDERPTVQVLGCPMLAKSESLSLADSFDWK